jgi:hypothetical protein
VTLRSEQIYIGQIFNVVCFAYEAGVLDSDTRTSSNTWMKRDSSPMMDNLYRRAASALGVRIELVSIQLYRLIMCVHVKSDR